MEERKKVLLIDVDGSFFDIFAKVDKKIINKLFGWNIFVTAIDFILRFFNSCDLVTNSMWILKLRIFIYSFLSFSKYSNSLKVYKKMYIEALDKFYKPRYAMMSDLRKRFLVVFITNNEFTLGSEIAREFSCVYSKNHFERKRKISKIASKRKVFCFVGNNFMDDFLAAKKERMKFVYIGKSKIVKVLTRSKMYRSFGEVVANLGRE